MMFPRNVQCDDCGQVACVCRFGRIEYDWPQAANPGRETTIPRINCVRLTIECPHCGMKSQDFFPYNVSDSRSHRHYTSFDPASNEGGRSSSVNRISEIRFQRIGPLNRGRYRPV
jgi:hypothetical protein